MDKDILFSDLSKICKPSQNISDKCVRNMWYACPYETGHVSGTMLVSLSDSIAEDVVLYPDLSGWYKIYVGLYGTCESNCEIELKLSGDEAPVHLAACTSKRFHDHYIEDVFWKCASMDGENIVIGKHLSLAGRDYAIAWLHFVHMSEEEVKSYQSEKERTNTKEILKLLGEFRGIDSGIEKAQETWRTYEQFQRLRNILD